MTSWRNVLKEVPTDGATVWIVRLPFFDTPTLATYDEATLQFTWTDSNTNPVTIELNAVFKWRPA